MIQMKKDGLCRPFSFLGFEYCMGGLYGWYQSVEYHLARKWFQKPIQRSRHFRTLVLVPALYS
jgi:hypothetical protein